MLEEEVKPGHNSEYSSFYGKLVVIFFSEDESQIFDC